MTCLARLSMRYSNIIISASSEMILRSIDIESLGRSAKHIAEEMFRRNDQVPCNTLLTTVEIHVDHKPGELLSHVVGFNMNTVDDEEFSIRTIIDGIPVGCVPMSDVSTVVIPFEITDSHKNTVIMYIPIELHPTPQSYYGNPYKLITTAIQKTMHRWKSLMAECH